MFPMFLTLLVAATAAQSTIPRRPTLLRRGRRRQNAVGPRIQSPDAGNRQDASDEDRSGDRELHGVDDRREDVRQLGHTRPAGDLSVDRVIAGWTEGVQLMVTGEKRRFWIPEALA
jgi:peptidylprolyl isomerase